jgi:hypothetical protein
MARGRGGASWSATGGQTGNKRAKDSSLSLLHKEGRRWTGREIEGKERSSTIFQ